MLTSPPLRFCPKSMSPPPPLLHRAFPRFLTVCKNAFVIYLMISDLKLHNNILVFVLQLEHEKKLPSSHSFNELYKLSAMQRKDNIMLKLASDTEGTMTMVGSLESLKKPVAGFVRLAKGTMMPNLMEVQIPVRFIFVLFTPQSSLSMDCHEIGRAFSTLMNNKVLQLLFFKQKLF